MKQMHALRRTSQKGPGQQFVGEIERALRKAFCDGVAWYRYGSDGFEKAVAESIAALRPSTPDAEVTQADERADVVAWLRDKVAPCRQAASDIGEDDDEALTAWVTRADTYEFAADAIERGDHR